MKRSILTVILIHISMLTACDSRPTCDNGYTIVDAAKLGCRSPGDVGCATCCTQSPTSCKIRSWSPNKGSSGVAPWYNDIKMMPSCPTNCAKCASCLAKDEQNLCQMLAIAPNGCNCEQSSTGGDPCYDPASCACYCFNYQPLVASCPTQ